MRTSTRYQKSIKAPNASTLKPGRNNKKLGFKITKGKKSWRGKVIYSLTLVERETCPTSCHHWDDCYGDNMPFAHRFSLDGLETSLEQELDDLNKKHKKGIVVRLHVLGDFHSVDYIRFWSLMLLTHPTMTIFGYTGREEDSEIGLEIAKLNKRFPATCFIRYSRSKEYSGDNRYAAEESFEGESFDCPEQTGKVANCANCGLCWTTNKTVRFLTH